MKLEKCIVSELGEYFVLDANKQYTVYRNGITAANADSSYPHTNDGRSIALARMAYLSRRTQHGTH